MSDHGNYFEKVDIENDVLGTVLLKYKNQGVFDEVVDVHPNIDYPPVQDAACPWSVNTNTFVTIAVRL